MALKLQTEKQCIVEMVKLQIYGFRESAKLTQGLIAVHRLARTSHLHNPFTKTLIEGGPIKEFEGISIPLLLSALETIKLLDRLSK